MQVRVSQDTEHFLLNPFGMLYNEITASSLVKVDMQGSVVEAGTTNFGVNIAGFMLHSAIHASRPDLKCIIHLHTPNLVAVRTTTNKNKINARLFVCLFAHLFFVCCRRCLR